MTFAGIISSYMANFGSPALLLPECITPCSKITRGMWLIYAIIAAADFKMFWTLSDMKENKQSVKKMRNSAHKSRTNEARETALFLYIRLSRSYFTYKGLVCGEGKFYTESKKAACRRFFAVLGKYTHTFYGLLHVPISLVRHFSVLEYKFTSKSKGSVLGQFSRRSSGNAQRGVTLNNTG